MSISKLYVVISGNANDSLCISCIKLFPRCVHGMKDVSSISVLGSLVSTDRIDDSGGTVNSPMAVQYNTGKAALIRAVGCIQEELNLDGENNIAVYGLHPGG